MEMYNNLYLLSSNELAQASNIQQQISQKEFEKKLVEINSRYLSSQESVSYYYNQQRKLSLDMELSNLISQRDGYINSALLYGLMLAEKELSEHQVVSSALTLIANVRTFLAIQNISLAISFPVMLKMVTLHTQLQKNNNAALSLKQELTNLRNQLHIQ